MFVKLRAGVGRVALCGRGEQGACVMQGEYVDVADEYIELGEQSRPDRSSDRVRLSDGEGGERLVQSCVGGLDGKAASSRGSNIERAAPGLLGMGIML